MYNVELTIEEICLIKSALFDLGEKLQEKKIAIAHFGTNKEDVAKLCSNVDETRLEIYDIMNKLNEAVEENR